MTKCSRDGCTKEANGFPKVCLPWQGGPINADRCPNIIAGVPLCHDHCKSFPLDADVLNNATFTKAMDLTYSFRKDRIPDFARIFAVTVVFGSVEYDTYIRLKNSQ